MKIDNNIKRIHNDDLRLALSCGVGMENLIIGEIEDFGGRDAWHGPGIVTASATLEVAYRCCLWSRFASKVLVELAQFAVADDDDLYNGCCLIGWPLLFSVDSSFAVSCTLSKNAVLQHNQFAALRVKDAIVDTFRTEKQARPSVKSKQPDIQFHLHVEGNVATLYLDFSGESLHRRGYREATVIAPLKETLGAVIVALSGWRDSFCELMDPMCGSGTLLIEAAMMFGDVAPGLSRKYFGFFGWTHHQDGLWQKLVSEAIEREDTGLDKQWPCICGYDSDPEAVRAARKNIRNAGFENYIVIEQKELAFLPPAKKTAGLVVCNLPYGERLSDREPVASLYRGVGSILRERYPGWQAALFISDPQLTDKLSLQFSRKYKLMNGSIPCRLLVGEVTPPENNFTWLLPPSVKNDTGDFANRLKKNLKSMMSWAAKNNVDCFRIYDADLPEYNLAVDIYGKWLHIQEYVPPKSVDEDLAKSRFDEALAAVREIFGVRSDRIFFKRRQRQRGKQQYMKQSESGKFHEVREGNCRFLVNFTDYLDTGLFLDHRPMRSRIGVEACGKNFLNLFGYTGTATVHAALGGASSTTTVDLSRRYLEWTRCNLALNGLAENSNKVVQGDVLEWLQSDQNSYDLIFIDPPTFSNTKKEKRVFDVQRDHVELIKNGMNRLASDGVLFFSTNSRKFVLAEEISALFVVKDISRDSIPWDFARNPRIHKCWQITR